MQIFLTLRLINLIFNQIHTLASRDKTLPLQNVLCKSFAYSQNATPQLVTWNMFLLVTNQENGYPAALGVEWTSMSSF